MSFARPVVSHPESQRIGANPRGGHPVVHLIAAETNGALGIWEGFPPAGRGPDWHMHTREVETFIILEGEFRVWCGDEVFDAPPGSVVCLPPNVPHQWKNVGLTPGRIIGIVSPGGFEGYFSDLEHQSGGEVGDQFGVVWGMPPHRDLV